MPEVLARQLEPYNFLRPPQQPVPFPLHPQPGQAEPETLLHTVAEEAEVRAAMRALLTKSANLVWQTPPEVSEAMA